MLTLRHCRLHPDRTDTLELRCSAGAVTVVLGRNNSGKTALCRLIAGLPSQASADISYDGGVPNRRGGVVAMVFQAFVNYPNWNVAQNIASPMLAAGKRDGQRVRELAALVKIDHLLERMPEELSGGQQQRLAIARALAKDPAVLVMDEPFVNLDFKLREALNAELRTLARETGIALVFTTSDPGDALALADHLVLLERYKCLQQGAPLELYRSPVSLRAAGLLSDPGVNRLSSRQFVRPEHVGIGNGDHDQASSRQTRLRGLLQAVETNGAQSYLHLDVGTEHGVEEWVAKIPGIVQQPRGSTLDLLIDDQDILELAS